MNSPMSEPTASALSLRSAIAMLAFTLVFTALMAGTYLLTHEKIAQGAEAEKLAMIDQILPRTSYDNDLLHDTLSLPADQELGLTQGGTVWRARRGAQNEALVLEAGAPDGYGGHIALIIAVGADGRIRGVRAVEHRETRAWATTSTRRRTSRASASGSASSSRVRSRRRRRAGTCARTAVTSTTTPARRSRPAP